MTFEDISKIPDELEQIQKTYELFREDTRLNRSQAARVEFLTNTRYIERYLKPGDRILDVGAGALLVPQIDTADQVRAVVSAAKYGPVGTRGTNRFVRSACYGAMPGSEYFAKAQETMVIIQAEGKKAVENLDEILDVPGVDVLFIGPYDLSSSLGHVGEVNHPDVIACIQGIIEKANAKGVKLGCFADTVEGAKKWRDMGIKFVSYTCDTYLFYQAAKADVDAFANK